MADSDPFQSRLAGLSDTALAAYRQDPLGFRTEAVEAALAEWMRRGHPLPAEEVQRIRALLQARDAEQLDGPGLLGPSPEVRRRRARRLAVLILALGLGGGGYLYRSTAPPPPNPLGYEPEDTKAYLRNLEMVGGKANVAGVAFQRWLRGLWQGPQLGLTVAWLSVALAGGLWLTARPTRSPHARS